METITECIKVEEYLDLLKKEQINVYVSISGVLYNIYDIKTSEGGDYKKEDTEYIEN